MTATLDRLYERLPAIYRERDAEEGYPLRALLRIIARQVSLVEGDIGRLYDDLFIETCAPWVIPYIGDLVGNDLLYDASRITGPDAAKALFPDLVGPSFRPSIAARARADVAKTIYYRRRKGTLPMLEELARDVTGWPAHAVEFFELLGWTQHLEHLRPRSRWTDVRSVDRMDRVNGAFDETSHTVDVRAPAQHEGWHNLHNVGFFLWRLRAYPLQRVPARGGDQRWQYHFSPLGNPAPLFTRWRREGDDAGLATELHVPAPIRHAFFYEDLVRYRNQTTPRADFTDLYGMFEPDAASPLVPAPEASFFIYRNGVPIAATAAPASPPASFVPQLVCRRLDPWPATQPVGAIVAVDVDAGRIAIGDGWPDTTQEVDVWYHYGFGADLGGGPYERRRWLIRRDLAPSPLVVKQDGVTPPGAPAVTHTSVSAALADWALVGRPDQVITILDSRTYDVPATITLRNEGWLVIEAANGERPVLRTQISGGMDIGLGVDVAPPATPGDPDRRSALTLSGVVVEGFVHVVGDLGRLRLLHTTLVPGRHLNVRGDGEPDTAGPSLVVDGVRGTERINSELRVEAAYSIAGPLVVPGHATGIWLLDTIVDGLDGSTFDAPAIVNATGGASAPLTTERATILGSVRVRRLEASESVFAGDAFVDRTQDGCVRFSFVTHKSTTPRRFRCQPETAAEAAVAEALAHDPGLTAAQKNDIRAFVYGWLQPAFSARRYGRPGYGQLALRCPSEIRTGAEDGAEMGAFNHLKQPQRESNLRIRLREYLPFGLEPGIIYVT